MITDHKDVVSNCGNAVSLLDRKIVLLLEFKKWAVNIFLKFLFQDIDLL